MKEIIVDGYFVKNLGDDLFLKALTQAIPNKKINIITSKKWFRYYKSFQNINCESDVLIKQLLKYIPVKFFAQFVTQIFGRNKSYVLLGGSLFIEGSWTEAQIKFRRYNILISDNRFIIGSNFGPFSSEKFKRNYLQLFNEFNSIVWRDEYSAHLFEKDMLPQIVLPDVVLSLNVPVFKKVNNNDYVIVNVMNIAPHGFSEQEIINYQLMLKNYIIKKTREGLAVHLLSVNRVENDQEIAENLKFKFFSNNNLVKVIEYENLNQIFEEFCNAEAILATRYHAMILSWLYKKPVHVLSYSKKVVNFINTWNKSQKFTNIDTNSFELDAAAFNSINSSDLAILKVKASKVFDDFKNELS